MIVSLRTSPFSSISRSAAHAVGGLASARNVSADSASVCQIGNLVRVTLVRVAARAVVLMVRDAEQQVPRGKTSGLREAKRRSAADAQLKCMERCETGLALQAGLACSTDLRCVGVLPWHSCAFLVVSSVASEDSC